MFQKIHKESTAGGSLDVITDNIVAVSDNSFSVLLGQIGAGNQTAGDVSIALDKCLVDQRW